MKLAVLGVGLVGGSIGLAARRRLDAEVVGFDPDPEVLARGLELGALDRACGSVGEAVEGASVAFCAAPVGALAELAREALARSGEECVVSDVGSTKRELVAGLEAEPSAERFIGGHPLAGAETSGVENARAELFEGARWYLTPTASSGGVLYDRLQRTIADLGGRPQAIDAGSHDRLMASVSHLPHVLANVLVDEAAEALAEESERMPEVGPSFRDAARVAGSNPAIWPDIFATNSEAVVAAIERVIARLGEAVRVLREGERTELAAWHGRARESRRSLLEVELVGGTLRELRVVVENRPGTVAEIALALGRAGVNIEDMGLSPAADMRSGAISLWIAGGDEAERAAEVVRGLGHAVTLVQAEA